MVFKIEQNCEDCRYPSNVERIIKIAAMHGIILSPQEAEKAWEEHSDNLSASWLIMDDCSDGDIWFALPRWARGE